MISAAGSFAVEREHGIAHSWFDGIVPVAPVAPGTLEEADRARLGAARLVRRAAELPACPDYFDGKTHVCDHPAPCARRAALSSDAQWLTSLFDCLGLWPDTSRNQPQAKAVRDCGPMSPGPRRLKE